MFGLKLIVDLIKIFLWLDCQHHNACRHQRLHYHYLDSAIGHIGDSLVRADDQLYRNGPARTKGATVSLLVEPVHRLQDLEELEHALEVAEHRVLPEVLLDQLP